MGPSVPTSALRVAAAVVGGGLLLTAIGFAPVGHSLSASAAPTTASAAERQAVRGFYAAQSFTSPVELAARELPRSVRVASNARVDYFRDFHDAYAENPAVEVRSLRVRSKVLSKKVVGGSTQYTVSVSVEFGLYDREAKQPFTGGETMDHSAHRENVWNIAWGVHRRQQSHCRR